jgi:hypothetical protein
MGVRWRVGVYMLLMMRIYVLLVMRVDITVRVCGCVMVMPHMVMPARNRVTWIITVFNIMIFTAMVMWVHCMRVVYVVMGVSIGGMVMTIVNMVRS